MIFCFEFGHLEEEKNEETIAAFFCSRFLRIQWSFLKTFEKSGQNLGKNIDVGAWRAP